MDNSHIHSPIVTYDYFETQQRGFIHFQCFNNQILAGEIRYDTDYIPTPFYPKYDISSIFSSTLQSQIHECARGFRSNALFVRL